MAEKSIPRKSVYIILAITTLILMFVILLMGCGSASSDLGKFKRDPITW